MLFCIIKGNDMSLKKSWFSYVLWFIFAGMTVVISYSVLTELFQAFYENICQKIFAGYLYSKPIMKLLTVIIAAGVLALFNILCKRMKVFTLPKWCGVLLHALFFIFVLGLFCYLRLPAILNDYSQIWSNQAEYFYQASKIGASVTESTVSMSYLERVYSFVLSGIFLFFGNKPVMMHYFQLFLQTVSLLLLILIGFHVQKGLVAWIPAIWYAVSPYSIALTKDCGPASFWFLVVLFGLFLICLFERAWKCKNITYIVFVLYQLIICGVIVWIKSPVLFLGKSPFVSGGLFEGNVAVYNISVIIFVVFMLAYCVSFWFDKQDHKSLYIIPFATLGICFIWLSNYEFDIPAFLMMFTALNFCFLFMESLKITFRANPKVLTGNIDSKNACADMDKQEEETEEEVFDWTQMQAVMEETKEVIDKTAMIENVLPMPKKHVPKVIDYAFEPSEEQMHYDIEIENDDYDY